MKIQCINIYNESTREFQQTSSTLTIGKEYVVLSLVVYQDHTLYRIVGDNEDLSPTLHNAEQFKITSHKVPSSWRIYSGEYAIFSIEPEAWHMDDLFWDKCFDDSDPEALEIYKREVRKIYEEEGIY